jgi:serine/threonine protein kinase
MQPTKSAQEICDAIERYRLMSSKDLAAMRARWFRPDRRAASDPEQFLHWLVLNQYVTDFVAKVVSGRKSDHLVLNEYRVLDQLSSGPMAGAYLAIDPLDRRVALEVLDTRTAANKTALQDFEEAARLAVQVQHPNVGRIVEVGEAHGLHYLVKEYYEGQTLEEILRRRKTMPYLQAARLMALACVGLDALHSRGVPAGELSADCLILTRTGKDAHQRTVKILHAGVQRRLFDDTALGRSVFAGELTAEQVQRSIELAQGRGAAKAADDLFRLGCLFYRCVSGQAPYSDKELPFPTRPAKPVAEVAAGVPEMLGQLIDEMIDPDPKRRPQKAAHVAKSLRVFLAAEEHAGDVPAEENIARPTERSAPTVAEEATSPEAEQDEDEEVEETPRRRVPRDAAASAPWQQALAWWDENRPRVRDLLYLAGGALGMLALIFLVELFSGLRLTYVAGLATGMVASYFVDLFVRWREKKKVELSEG